jgi:hypothetical protein
MRLLMCDLQGLHISTNDEVALPLIKVYSVAT